MAAMAPVIASTVVIWMPTTQKNCRDICWSSLSSRLFDALLHAIEPLLDGLQPPLHGFEPLVDCLEAVLDGLEATIDYLEAALDRLEALLHAATEFQDRSTQPLGVARVFFHLLLRYSQSFFNGLHSHRDLRSIGRRANLDNAVSGRPATAGNMPGPAGRRAAARDAATAKIDGSACPNDGSERRGRPARGLRRPQPRTLRPRASRTCRRRGRSRGRWRSR